MKIKIKQDCAMPGYAFKPGASVEVPEHIGQVLVNGKYAEQVADDAEVASLPEPPKRGANKTAPAEQAAK